MGIAAAVIVPDQWSKYLLRSRLGIGEVWYPWDWLAPYIQIVRAQNTGAAFSLGEGMGWIFILAAIGAIVAILSYVPRLPAHGWLIRVSLGLVIGGAAGNLIDRLLYGHVTDFISVSHFAVLNLADIFINIGVALLVLWLLRLELTAKKRPSDPLSPEQPPSLR